MNRSILSLASLALLSSLAACGGSPDPQGSAHGPGGATPAPAQGTVSTADWSCVGAGQDQASSLTVSASSGAAQAGTTTLHVREAYTQNAVAEATVALCDLFDESCASPLAQAQSDDGGDAQMVLPPGFGGYFQISGSALPTNLVYLAGAHVGPTGLDLTVYTGATLAMTAQLVTPPADPSGAVVSLQVLDCRGEPAPGVSLNIESNGTGAREAYFVGGGATMSTGARATDASGIAFAFDVPAGWVGVVGMRASDATPVGGAIGLARAGAVTSILLTPYL